MEISLHFQKGTLSVDLPKENAATIPRGFVWDDRTANFRAPAYVYRRVSSQIDAVDCVARQRLPQLEPQLWRDIPLHDYQRAACSVWQEAGNKGLIVLPTGAGKSRVATQIIKTLSVPTLILVPTRALLTQWIKSIAEFYEGPVGIIGDGEFDLQSISVCTFQSAYLRMQDLGARFSLLVVDEVHHFGGSRFDEALIMSSAQYRLGLSASLSEDPDQLRRTESLIGSKVYEKPISDLVGDYLSDYEYLRFFVDLNNAERQHYNDTYQVYQDYVKATKWSWQDLGWSVFNQMASQSKEGQVALAAARHGRSIVGLAEGKIKILQRLLAKHWQQRIFIFVASTNDVYAIARMGFAYPLSAAIRKNERKFALEKFASGEIRVLVACKVLNEGIDVPAAEVAIILGGESEGRHHIQRVGRVLRKREGKKAMIYELIAANTYEVNRSQRRNKRLKG